MTHKTKKKVSPIMCKLTANIEIISENFPIFKKFPKVGQKLSK